MSELIGKYAIRPPPVNHSFRRSVRTPKGIKNVARKKPFDVCAA
jgi:hypothetical protein